MDSPIKWTGGKRKEIKYFAKYIPKFDTYVEPFVGGGALYWHLKPKIATINDINAYLINFYEVLRDNYNELIEGLQKYRNTKEEFNKIVDVLNNKKYISNVELAEIFYYLNKTCFSGKWRVNSKGQFNNTFGSYKKDNYKILDSQHSLILNDTEIHNKDYKEILNKYKNDSNTFLFLDPPYLDCDTMYTETQSFDNIYDCIYRYIQECKSKVMLVVKGDDYIRKLFSNYIVDEYQVNYRHNATSKKIHNHVVIINY